MSRCLLALCLLGLARPASLEALEITYLGRVEFAAHYPRPGETRPYLVRQVFSTNGHGRVRLDGWTWAPGDSSEGEPETYVLAGDAVYHRDSPAAAWERLPGERGEVARLEAVLGLPGEIYRHLPAPSSGRQSLARADTLGTIQSYEERRGHPRLGDVADGVTYWWSKDPVPDSLSAAVYHRDHDYTLHVGRVSWREEASAESLFAPPAHFEVPALVPDQPTAPPVFTELAPGVWAAAMEDLDTRSLVVEFADHLAVIEFAVGSRNGERLVDGVKARWPRKPIRWALFSHHHPHYLGGVRALCAEGATIVTTTGNVDLVRRLCAASFTLDPDRLARAPREPAVQAFQERFELADSTNRLVAVDIGARSTHTDEFTIFWLPRAGIVFETEQGWFSRDGALSATRRTAGFLKVLDDEKLTADRIVQSWPMQGTAAMLTRAELEALVKARAAAK